MYSYVGYSDDVIIGILRIKVVLLVSKQTRICTQCLLYNVCRNLQS